MSFASRPSSSLFVFGVAFAFACSSEVTDDQTATSGAGGAPASASSTTGTPTSTSTSAAGGSGGATTSTTSSNTSAAGGSGTVCDEACSKIEQRCMLGDLCSMFMGALDCGQPGAECVAQCILDGSCQDILALIAMQPAPRIQACVQGCLGGGTGGGGGAGGGANGCVQCEGNNCQAEAIACVQDNECQAWLGCVQPCADAPCIANCNAMHANAAALYEPIIDCTCTSCSAECAAIDPCSFGGTGGGMP